jgi:hypothetical protein
MAYQDIQATGRIAVLDECGGNKQQTVRQMLELLNQQIGTNDEVLAKLLEICDISDPPSPGLAQGLNRVQNTPDLAEALIEQAEGLSSRLRNHHERLQALIRFAQKLH